MLVSFGGAAIISFGEGEGFALNPGTSLILLSATSVSVYFVLQKPYLAKYGALTFTTYAVWAGTLLSVPYLPGLVTQTSTAPAGAISVLVYLGVFPTALAYVTYAYAFSRMDASVAVSFLYLIPVLAYVVAFFWLGEAPSLLSAGGVAMVLCGVLIVNRRGAGRGLSRRSRGKTPARSASDE